MFNRSFGLQDVVCFNTTTVWC